MMKKLFISLIFFTVLPAFSQITFEKAYIINNKGEKQTGLIKNYDWRNNPDFIEFKKSAGSPVQKLGIKDIKAFEIYNSSKYERHNVKIDRSSDDIIDMSTQRNPEFQNETLFLKFLVEGDASLYQYIHGNLMRFFYKIDNQPVTQLVYKKYKVNDDLIKTNTFFRQQLLNSLHCPSFNAKTFKYLEYDKKDMVEVFSKYNKCKNNNYKTLTKKNKSKFSIIPKMQIRKASLSMSNKSYENKTRIFEPKTSLAFGVELGYTFPFNKNKWALTIEPTYQNYSNSLEITDLEYSSTDKIIRHVYYSSIELPLSIKYSMFLNFNNKIFTDFGIVSDFAFPKSHIDFEDSNGTIFKSLDVNSVLNFSLGIGYAHRNLSVEIRYQNKRDISARYAFWSTDYHNLSLILGYKIFEKHF